MVRSGRSSTTQSPLDRATGVRLPVTGSLTNIVLFQTHRPRYFSLATMVWMVDTAQPRLMGPCRVAFPGKGSPSALSLAAMAFMLRLFAYRRKIRRTISASGSKTSHWGAVHAGVQRLVVEGLDLRPREPGRAGAQHRGADGAAADPQALRHLPVGAPEAPLLSQDLPCLAHGQSLGRHPSPFRGRTVRPTVPRRYASAIALITMPRSR